MREKASKNIIVVAVIATLICAALLAGYTYAWFTDRAQVVSNRIVAGTLDIGLEYTNSALDGAWYDVELLPAGDFAPFFVDSDGNEIKWEPGAVAYASFRITNKGDRALRYEFLTYAAQYNTVLDEVGADTGKSLTDVIKLGEISYPEGESARLYFERDELIAKVGEWKHLDEVSKENLCLKEGESEQITLVLYWEPTGSDNLYNMKDGKLTSDGDPLFVDADITLVATQAMLETDSFDEKYDENAEYAFSGNSDTVGLENNTDTAAMTLTIETAEQLLAFAQSVNSGNTYSGYTVMLTSDVSLGGYDWEPIGATVAFEGDFNGNGHTVRALSVKVSENAGLFAKVNGNITALNVDGAYISSQSCAGAIAAYVNGDVTDCGVTDTVIEAIDESGENGDKVGAIVGHSGDGAYSITGNSAKNVRLTANRECGVIAGAVSSETSAAMADNIADNVGVRWSGYGTEGDNMGPNPENAHVGRVG